MDEEKKQKQYQYYLFKIFILLIIVVLSFLLGNYFGSKEEFTIEKPRKNQSSNKIAVVDLDDGVEIGNEKKFYSKEIIELPDLNFVHTALGDARSGLEEGVYGAYIVIPSTFSENVSSINKNPTKAKLKCEIGNNLDESIRAQVIYNLLKFEKKVNNDLGYVYVNNILKEFHKAQDISKKVMKNDLKDKQAILEIEPNDLIEMVNMPELERVDNTAEPIDFPHYISKNQDLISAMNEEFTRQIDVNLKDMYAFVDEGKDIIIELNKMIDAVGKVDVLKDENGNLVYEAGRGKLNSEMRNYNDGLSDNKKDIQGNMENVLKNQNRINSILFAVEEFNNDLEEKIGENQNTIKQDLLKLIPKMRLDISEKEMGISYGKNSPSINIGIEKVINDEEEEEREEREEKAYLHAIQRILTEVNKNDDMKDKLKSDERLVKLIEEAGYEELEDILKEDITKKMSKKDEHRLKFEGDMEGFQGYVENVMGEEFKPDIDSIKKIGYNPDEPDSISKLIYEQDGNIGDANSKIGEIKTINDSKLNKIIEDDVLKPIKTRRDIIGDAYDKRLKVEEGLIKDYGNNISAYSPIDGSTEIRDKSDAMSDNTMDLSANIHDNNEKYLSLVDKVFENNEKNTNLLFENIHDAMESSEKKISAGLKDAKNIKYDTSKENQELLDSFSKKLGYTRVGSLEHTQVYDFIVNPVNIENSNDIVKNGIDIDISKKEDRDNFQVTESESKLNLISNYKVLIIVCVSLVFLLIIFILLNRKEV